MPFLRIRTADNATWQVKGQWAAVPNAPAVRVDDADWSYTGTWFVGQNTSALGGTDHYTNATGAVASRTFEGPSVKVFGPKENNAGIIEARIDGGAAVDWDGYNATRLDGALLGEFFGLVDGPHTITLTCSGRKHASSSNTYVGVDWLEAKSAGSANPLPDAPVESAPSGATISKYLLPGKRPTSSTAEDGNPFLTPIGANAVSTHAGLGYAGAYGGKITVDPIHVALDATAPVRDLTHAYKMNGTPGSPTQPNYIFPAGTRVRIPAYLASSGGWNSIGVLLSDDLSNAWQGQTLYLGAGGNASWPFTIPPSKVSLTSASPAGAHGGSGLSALLGTVRAWEWSDDTVVIEHALLINLLARKYLRGRPQGETSFHVWPATVADDYAGHDGQGGRPYSANHYGSQGSPPAGMKMGALLRLPSSYNVAGMTNIKAKRLATALRDFGGYVGDDTAWDVHALSVESSVESSFLNQSSTFHGELMAVFQALHVVTDNSATNIGGAGAFIRPIPTALAT